MPDLRFVRLPLHIIRRSPCLSGCRYANSDDARPISTAATMLPMVSTAV